LSVSMNEIEESYMSLAQALPGMVEAAWDQLASAEEGDLERIAELHERGWLYAYAVLIHRVRKHELIEKILGHARRMGFTPQPRYDYDSEEDEFAYRLVGRSRRMSEGELQSVLEGMCCLALEKGGDRPCVPLLKIDWEEDAFSARLVPWTKIGESIERLSS